MTTDTSEPLSRRRMAGLATGLLLTLLASTTPAQPAAQKKVLYVTRLSAAPDAPERLVDIQQKSLASDQVVRAHLESRGFAVTLADQGAAPALARGYDLVVLSSSVQSREMTDTGYKDQPVPLLTWENDLFDSLRLTGRRKDIDYGEVDKEHYIRIVNAPHPMAAGLPAGKTHVYPRDIPMGWGTPSRSAIVIATLPGDADKAVVFGYEQGATMDYDFIAPARRVALFLDNETFAQLSPQGRKLFDAAVDWVVARPGK